MHGPAESHEYGKYSTQVANRSDTDVLLRNKRGREPFDHENTVATR